MGMFDEVRCAFPLPWPGANDFEWQTKSMGCELDRYEIREDGTLWHEDYDTEDRSDPNAEGFDRFKGMMTRVNRRWSQVQHNGEFEIHHLVQHRAEIDEWFSALFWFRDGVVRDVIFNKRPSGIGALTTEASP